MKVFGAGGLADAIMETCVWPICVAHLMHLLDEWRWPDAGRDRLND